MTSTSQKPAPTETDRRIIEGLKRDAAKLSHRLHKLYDEEHEIESQIQLIRVHIELIEKGIGNER
jgi:hypothetical protein